MIFACQKQKGLYVHKKKNTYPTIGDGKLNIERKNYDEIRAHSRRNQNNVN
jgi:hypothetical protein